MDGGGAVAFVEDGSDGVGDALLEGVLALDSGCLTVVSANAIRVLPVFRLGSASWDGTALTVDGGPYGVGDRVSLGGGYAPEPVEQASVPEDCEYDQAFHVAG